MCVTVLDIVHRPVFYLKRNVSETGLCLRRQVERTIQVSRFHQKTETESNWVSIVLALI
jgi:hypothetical protein